MYRYLTAYCRLDSLELVRARPKKILTLKIQNKMETTTQTQKAQFEIKSDYQKLSQFTALVYFKPEYAVNGSENGRKLHSWKYERVNKSGKMVQDHKFAYDRLVNCIMNDFNGKYKTAIIYHNATNTQVFRMAYNTLRLCREVVFKNDSTGLGTVFHAVK